MAGPSQSPSVFTGAWLAALLTAALAAVSYLAQQLAGLPFPPFVLFDWMARALPGPFIKFGIDAMVAVILALGFTEISAAAKTAEQALAVSGFVLGGALAGALLFGLLRRLRPGAGTVAGLVTGLLAGSFALLIGLRGGLAAEGNPAAASAWTLSLFVGWGALLGHAFRRLRRSASAEAVALDRRAFLIRLGGAAATVTVAGAWVGSRLASWREREQAASRAGAWSSLHALPNAGAAVEPVRGTRPELTPLGEHYRIDINAHAPVVREEDWRLRIGGLVERPMEWTLGDLRGRYAPVHQFITLSCISNPVAGSLIGTQRWTGVPLRLLLQEAGPLARASHLKIKALDGFHECVSLAEAMGDGRIMLTYAWDGLPLTAKHGFPLRIYLPDRYGMKQPKWIGSIELMDHEEDGYWVERGWDRQARMKTVSVIDAVGVDMMVVDADRRTRIPIGGIAHAGARGISRIEIQVDGGAWQAAELRAPLSEKTWVLWRFDWPFQAGKHAFTVRCVDGRGDPQIAASAPPDPSGATGLHSREAML